MDCVRSSHSICIKLILIIIQIIIFFSHNDQVKAKPMFGRPVRNVAYGQYHFIVSIGRRNLSVVNVANDHVCSGFLITKQDVITSAVCFTGMRFIDLTVVAGSVELGTGRRYDILWWITYSEWCFIEQIEFEYAENSIGNIRLRSLVPEYVQLGVISPLPNFEMYDKNIVIAGWGTNRQNYVPTRMRMARLRTTEMDICRQRLTQLSGHNVDLDDRYLCSATNPFVVMHRDDIGAPVMIDNKIVAIHSKVMPYRGNDLDPEMINIHLTLNYYRYFIHRVTNQNFNGVFFL